MEHNILTLIDTCTGCFACSNICSKNAISLVPSFEGFYYPMIDPAKCTDCGLCDKICPVLNSIETFKMSQAYYGWSLNANIRKASSSGGLFYHLASAILQGGGIVYGASFDYSETLRLTCRSTREVSLQDLMKSKYVQSYIGFAYRDMLSDLKRGLKVLFCGTPCQIAGLRSFLRKEYENLITVDFICHGVPSMDLFIKHLEYLHLQNVVEVNFRPKNSAWYDDFEIRYRNRNRVLLRKIPWMLDEYFYKLYAKNLSLRRSCRSCVYSNGNRPADITLADFWGINDYKPDLWDSKGISMLLINRNKSLALISILQGDGNCALYEMPNSKASYAFSHDRRDMRSEFQTANRDEFLTDVYSIGYRQSLIKHGLKTNKRDIVVFKVKGLIFKLRKILKLLK